MKRLTLLTWSAPKIKGEKTINLGAVILGFAWALSISVAVMIALGVYVMISTAPTYNLSTVLTLITLGSVFLGGMVCGAVAGKQGLLHGLIVGSAYALLYAALSLNWGMHQLELSLVGSILPIVIFSVIGGITGVNLPADRKKYRRVRRVSAR
ncbi:MAG: TIGR04086 family membrane protein [Firmicutes bacterium]|nr:TIGR04086 family membrane protein [Bacillota bacterium]